MSSSSRLLRLGLGLTLVVSLAASYRWWPRVPELAPADPAHPGAIEGQLLGADGKPRKTSLRLQRYTLGVGTVDVATDAAGRFAHQGLPAGRYWVTLKGVLLADVEVTSAKPKVQVNLTAPPPAVLRGRVTREGSGEPVPGAVVFGNLRSPDPLTLKVVCLGNAYDWAQYTVKQIAKQAKSEDVPFAITDRQGRYELRADQPLGQLYVVGPGKKDFPASWRWDSAPSEGESHDFALAPASAHAFRGTITLPDGKPFANRKATFFLRRHPERTREVATDAEGRYEFLPDYGPSSIVWVEVPGFALMHQYPSLDSRGRPEGSLDWALKPPQVSTLELTVLRPDGKSPARAGSRVSYMRSGPQPDAGPEGKKGHVYYRVEAEGGGYSGQTLDLHGGVLRKEFEPGAFAFTLRPAARGGRKEEPGKPEKSWFGPSRLRDFTLDWKKLGLEQVVIIDPGKTVKHKLTEPELSSLTLTVQDHKGGRVAEADIAAYAWSEDNRSYSGASPAIVSDAEGQALFDPLPSGRFVFRASKGQERSRPYGVRLEPGQQRELTLVLGRDERAGKPARIRVEGQIFLPDGVTPAAGAVYYLGRELEARGTAWVENEQSQKADEAGRFTLEAAPGKETVLARGEGTALTACEVEVKNEKREPLKLILKKPGSIEGKVAGLAGVRVSRIRVVALPRPLLHEPRNHGGPYGDGSHSLAAPLRADGTFALHGLAPGTHHVCLYHDGLLLPSPQEVVLKEGEVRRGIELAWRQPCPQIELTLRRADGEPLKGAYEVYLANDYGTFTCGGFDERGNIARSRSAVPPGRYHLYVDFAPGGEGATGPASFLVRDVKVPPGPEPLRMALEVPRGGGIKGRLLLPDGKHPASLNRVAIHHAKGPFNPYELERFLDGPPSYGASPVDPDGHFQIGRLRPGRYRIAVYPDRGEGEAPLWVSEPLTVEAGRFVDAGTCKLGAAR